MAAVVFAFGAREHAPRPWQNNELAELYRVVELLGRAGLTVDTDMGMSDEGDPWFVFCRADSGDVVVHFARIGGQYVAASSAVDQTYRGANFREIIDQLIRQQPLMMPRPSSGGARLFLHPAVVLTAFVATALIHAHRAEAADGTDHAVPVRLHTAPHDHQGSANIILRLLAADPSKISSAKVLPQLLSDGEPGTPLASLMAIAIAAIAPLVAQDTVSLSASDASPEAAAQHAPALAPAPGADAMADSLDTAGQPSHEAAPQAERPAAMTARHDDAFATITGPSVSLGTATSAHHPDNSVTAQASAVPIPPSATGTDHLLLHMPAHPATVQEPTAASPAVLDPTHHLDLGDVDPQALAALFYHTEDTGQTKGHGLGSAVIPAEPPTQPTAAAPTATAVTTTQPAAPTAAPVIDAKTPTALLDALSDFAFSPQHALTSALHPSATLTSYLTNYMAQNGPNLEMVVFDSGTVSLSMFPFVKGVVFVDDHQVASDVHALSGQHPVTIQFTDGGTMTLVGVVNIDAAHPLVLGG